ncbi:ankyrin repeat-containing protein [Anaeramoeba flamelloides]|uniref:Ankyrin repeat-containing protein n=1 Tax=Anaeramoeba flamelloides TaxID=1746091 RepID=A0ABQ8YKG2_9EUKA|nr:ankyrin repeat-containing protein [Anaeramoeba flamelloides]
MLDKDHDLLLLQDYKLLTSYPVSQYEIPDIDKITPLHLFCKQINHYEKNFEDFLGKITNFDPRDIFKRTPLHYLLKSNPKKKCVKALLECGVDVNSKDFYTPLHFACKFNALLSVIKLLIKYGANVNATTITSSLINKNFMSNHSKFEYNNYKQFGNTPLHLCTKHQKWLPEEHIHTKLLSGQLRSYRTITHDFHDLIKYEYGWNFEMATKKILKCHTCIFNYRFQNKITPEMINTVFESPKIKDIRPFIYWVYTGLLSVPKDKELIQNILLTLGHLDLFEIKNTRSKFLQDIEKIMNQNIGVDFKILLKDKYFFVHKIILVARLSWFRNKLLNPNGQFNSISILKINSSFTIKSFEIFISFVYTGRIDDNLNQDLVDELLVLCDHYGLSKYSALYYQILVSHLRNKKDDN